MFVDEGSLVNDGSSTRHRLGRENPHQHTFKSKPIPMDESVPEDLTLSEPRGEKLAQKRGCGSLSNTRLSVYSLFLRILRSISPRLSSRAHGRTAVLSSKKEPAAFTKLLGVAADVRPP
ncbi:hypothetical protein F1559_003388 [Cyanidiococcus yangmingshanensis]|uniref:Uncharacterized protein n=1 Tax=Cyanidiococcus yangmingshanensis TaxID=2690220 RepID=A0A7J7INI7_9RHOD|nr:hypothetical protein F1559_003388 [Cyanidiococcus yangmingshanensis]